MIRVNDRELEDVRMQNTVVLANIDKQNLIPGVTTAHYKEAMGDLLGGGDPREKHNTFRSSTGGRLIFSLLINYFLSGKL